MVGSGRARANLSEWPVATIVAVCGNAQRYRAERAASLKAVGERTNVPVAAAVANAVADAVGARIRRLPITAEPVYWAMQEGVRR